MASGGKHGVGGSKRYMCSNSSGWDSPEDISSVCKLLLTSSEAIVLYIR